MEEALNNLINSIVFKKYGLSCDVATYIDDYDMKNYVFIVNVKLNEIYPLFPEYIEGMDNLLRGVHGEDFESEISETVRYLSIDKYSVYPRIFFKAVDTESIPVLNESVKNTLEEVKQETGSECFKSVEVDFDTVLSSRKNLPSKVISALEEFCNCSIDKSFIGEWPYVHFYYVDGPCGGNVSTPQFFQKMVSKNNSMEFMIPKRKGGGNAKHY
jgi:hypothetical protein